MTTSNRAMRLPGVLNTLQWIVLLLGVTAVISSWFSIRPSAEYQYREMLALDAANPGTISAEEWINSEMDGVPKLLGLMLIGIPAFVIVTCSVAGISATQGQLKRVWLFVGLSWIFLGGFLHLLVWKL